MKVTIDSIEDLETVPELCEEAVEEEKRITKLQRNSLHKWCRSIADKMTDAGYTQKTLAAEFKDGFELPVTMHMIKDTYKQVEYAMYGLDSTEKLNTVQVQEVWKVVDKRFLEITGIDVPWPSREELMRAIK